MDAGISAMLMARQMRPPFSFWSYPKRERAAPGVREKGALAATLHVRAKLLYGGRREMVPAGLRGFAYGRGGVRYRLEGGFPRRGCVLGRGARTHLTGSSFPVSRCGAPRISVTSVPLVPPSARSAYPQGARRIRKRQSRQRLRSRYALPGWLWRLVLAGGRGRPPLRQSLRLSAFPQRPTHRSAPTNR